MPPKTDIGTLFCEHGLPLTVQRRLIYERLRSTDSHPGAEALHRGLKRRCPGLSLATVYKTLHTFRRLGLTSLVNARHAASRR